MSIRPVFIVGSERSGTTMLSVMLDRHSAIASTPETHFCYSFSKLQWRKTSNHEKLLLKLRENNRIKDLHLSGNSIKDIFLGYPPQPIYLFQVILETFGYSNNSSLVVEKSPHHVFYGDHLLNHFPDSRIIHIVRDGRDTVLSVEKTNWSWIHGNFARDCIAWRQCIKAGLALERHFPQRVKRVHYEHLLKDPKTVLSSICTFIGVSFEDSQLDPCKTSSAVPDWENFVKGKARECPDPSRIHSWRHTLDNKKKWMMNALMAPYLQQFGYPAANMDDCPLLQRFYYRLLRHYSLLVYSKPVIKAYENGKKLLHHNC